MPINAGPEYFAALDKAHEAKDPNEKLKWLLEAYRLLPKHKGTETERKTLMQRITKLKKEIESKKQQKKSGSKDESTKKEGEFQIVLFGFPNTYKSTLLKYFTGKDVKIDVYPFTTYEPEVATIDYKGAKIQMIELPGYKEDYEGKYYSILRNADIIAITATEEEQIKKLVEYLESKKISFKPVGKEKIKLKRKSGSYDILGLHNIELTKEEIIELLKTYGYYGCELTFLDKCTLDDLINVLENKIEKKGILFSTFDPKGEYNIKRVKLTGHLEKDKKTLIDECGYIEVYLKPQRKEVSPTPVLVKKGSTIETILRRFFGDSKPKQIRLRNKDKIKIVGLDYILNDKDIIEFIF